MMLSCPDPDGFWDGALRSRLVSSSGSVAGYDLSASSMTIEDLDREDSALQRVQSVLRFQRNSLLSVHRLPPEITALVFSFYVDETRRQLRSKHALGWIVITHVCRRWRQIALESAGLWQRVTFGIGDEWAEEMYRRSKGTILEVKTRSALTERQHNLVAKHLHRTKLLSLRAHPDSPPPSLLLSSDNPAPILETLEIEDPIRPEPAVLPLNRFGAFSPNLRHVTICTRAINLPWTSTLLTGLVTLKMRSTGHKDMATTPSPSLNQVLSALKRMKALESLELAGDLFPRSVSHAISKTAKLSRLVTLKLSGPMADCTSFLSHIEAPACTTFCLGLECSHASDEEIDDALSLLTSWATKHCAFASRALRLTTHEILDLWDLRMEAWRCDPGNLQPRVEMTDEEGDINVTFEWTADEEPDVPLSSLARMCFDAFTSPQLQQLVVDLDYWETEDWLDIMPEQPKLRRIMAGGQAADELVPALDPEAFDEGSLPVGTRVVLPLLTSLQL
ncbi:hypothetical protein BV25DRAFT_1826141 [Artomyces pyxidatus]|uniref:Uncharacterized protein n=1 Tax=Artomyces pyxidatus TaxID=48021 RepID=A0ACB8T0G6_9AGAM|nr:hypothetical protein BV25DRAFT_1826141 [Artomyces pyxidatus]